MKRFLALALAILLALGCTSALAATQVVKPGDDFYYLDTADVLFEATEGEIYFSNVRLYEACGAQIVVAALDSIGSADIYDYASEMFDSWGIGSSKENNGLLLLMAVKEAQYYVLPGLALRAYSPPARLSRCTTIICKRILPPDATTRARENSSRPPLRKLRITTT